MKKTQKQILDEAYKWGEKLKRTNNRLSLREIQQFHSLEKLASEARLDREFDRQLTQGRRLIARYDEFEPQQVEVSRWI